MNAAARFEIDPQGFFSDHDLVYHAPPKVWPDGLPLGNGDLYALAYQPHCMEWGVMKTDVWDRRLQAETTIIPHEEILRMVAAGRIEEIRQRFLIETRPFTKCLHPPPENRPDGSPVWTSAPAQKHCGRLRLNPFGVGRSNEYAPPLTQFEQRLSLYAATSTTTYKTEFSEGSVLSFVDANSDVLVVRCRDRAREKSVRTVELRRDMDPGLGDPCTGRDGDRFWIDYTFPDGFRYVIAASVTGAGYTAKKRAGCVVLELDATQDADFCVYVAVATSTEHADPLAETMRLLDRATKKGHEKIFSDHQEWWRDFWARSTIDLSDKFIENLWYFHLYVLATLARGPQPPSSGFPHFAMSDYQGWHNVHTQDFNTQQNLWATHISNHGELGLPYYEMFVRQLDDAQKLAQAIFGVAGAWFPVHSTDGYLGSVRKDGGVGILGGFTRYLMCVPAFTAENFWWHYLYTQDRQFLEKKAYPLMREVARFYDGYMPREADGTRCMYPSFAPEQWLSFPAKNPTQDLALIKEFLQAVIRASEILGKDADLRRTWTDLLEHLAPYPTDGRVFLDHEGADPHYVLQHPAPLTPIFPAGDVGMDSPEDRFRTARATFDAIFECCGRQGVNGIPCCDRPEDAGLFDLPVWADDVSYCQITATAARLGDGEAARAYLYDLFILQKLKHNGFFLIWPIPHPDRRDNHIWTLNNGTGFVAAVSEMLLQSYNGNIRVFPAVPPDWTGRFADLRAAGAFLVTSEIGGDVVKYILIESLAGEPCVVVNPWPGQEAGVRDLAKGETRITGRGKLLRFETAKGASYSVTRAGAPLNSFPTVTLSGSPRAEPRSYRGPQYLGDRSRSWTVYLGKPRLRDEVAS